MGRWVRRERRGETSLYGRGQTAELGRLELSTAALLSGSPSCRTKRHPMWRPQPPAAAPPLGLLLLALAPPAAAVQVGMMYEGWQAPAFWGRSRSNTLTIEGVVRSNGGATRVPHLQHGERGKPSFAAPCIAHAQLTQSWRTAHATA